MKIVAARGVVAGMIHKKLEISAQASEVEVGGRTRLFRPLFATLCIALCAAGACATGEEADPPPVSDLATPGGGDIEGLAPVVLPDLAEMNEAVQAQIRQRHAVVVSQRDDPTASTTARANAYGELGMILMAADLHDVASLCFGNAQALAPIDMRWPYYLGHLYRDEGDSTGSLVAFERAQQLQPDYMATLVYLGDTHLEEGDADLAEPFFTEALSLSPESLSARFGLARTALMKEEFAVAANYLEEILDRNADAAAAHYPLGIAYRGLGELEKAEEHLLLRENEGILPADPLMATLDVLLESPQAYERRGIESLDGGDLEGAEALFKEGLELDPTNPSLRHRLGTALFLKGDERGALAQFEEVVRSSPEYPPALFSLGVVYQNSGRHREAIERFETALEYRPTYPEARLMLATSLRRTGNAEAALPHYEQVLTANPDVAEARFGRAMAYVQLHRYQEARDRLTREMELYPQIQSFPHVLARLLAAAPDDRVRNGERALELMQPLIQGQRSLNLGETMAMVLAELGRFDEAISIQQSLIDVAPRSGLGHLLGTLTSNLALYEQGQPARTPWPQGEIP